MSGRFLVTYGKVIKDEQGRNLCHICGKVVPKGRRTLCSDECAVEREIRGGVGIRYYVKKRDHGICAHCGLDCEALYDELQEMSRKASEPFWHFRRDNALHHFMRENKFLGNTMFRALWEAHHKVAVAEGGGGCGLDNYETVCWRCHAKETGALRRRLNEKAKEKANDRCGEKITGAA